MPTVIIVSLIDIFVILLIFVIVTTTFKRDIPHVVINVPKSKFGATGNTPTDPIMLTVTSSDEMFLDGQAITPKDLKAGLEKLTTEAPNRTLVLNADKKASFGFIIQVYDTLRDAGVTDIPAFTEKK